LGAVHRYEADWETLAAGQTGITGQLDTDGDGKVDEEIRAGTVLEGVQVPAGDDIPVEFPHQEALLRIEKVIAPGYAFLSASQHPSFVVPANVQIVGSFYRFEVTAEYGGWITIQSPTMTQRSHRLRRQGSGCSSSATMAAWKISQPALIKKITE